MLPSHDFWGELGRLGVITTGEWMNRLVLMYPDSLPGSWTFVVSSSIEEGPLDFYLLSDVDAEQFIEQSGVVWLALSLAEDALEKRIIGWRETLRAERRRREKGRRRR